MNNAMQRAARSAPRPGPATARQRNRRRPGSQLGSSALARWLFRLHGVMLASSLRLLLLPALVGQQVASHASVEEVVVDPAAPAGSVATVHAARDAVRQLLADRPGSDVFVRLAPGVHHVGAAALELGVDDSPAAGSSGTVTWTSLDPSSPATISAALPVTGWKAHATRPGVLAAPIPPAAGSRHSAIRHFWVNSARAFKPRYYPAPGSIAVVENSSGPHGASLPYGGYYFNTSTIDPASLHNPTGIEFVYTGRAGARAPPPDGYAGGHERGTQSGEDPWTEMRCTVASVTNRSVALKRACWNALPFAGAEDTGSYARSVRHQPPAYLENVEANFTQPGSWYLDTAAGEVLYRPRAGESLAEVENTATTSINSTLLVLRGARNHRWVGIGFEYAVWDPLSVEQQG